MRRPSDPASVRAVVLLVVATAVAASGPALAQPGDGWQLDVTQLKPPFDAAGAFTVVELSADGHMLVLGLDNGHVLFYNATTGSHVDAWEAAPDHGAPRSVSLTDNGRRAALVYEDGFVAVLDVDHDDPLLELNEGDGAPPEARPRVSATLSASGNHLVVTGPGVSLYRTATINGTLAYAHVATRDEQLGPHVYLHPRFLVFGALGADGAVALYQYNSQNMVPIGQQDIATDADGTITALTVSGDGGRFAVAFSSGKYVRYQPVVAQTEAKLRPDYEGTVDGTPRGLHLDGDGLRLAVWSENVVVWANGCNRNVNSSLGCPEANPPTRILPPLGTPRNTITGVDASGGLERVLVRFVGGEPQTRLYNMPSLESFRIEHEAEATGPIRLDTTGTRAFEASGPVLTATHVTPAQLAPVRPDDPAGGGALFGLSTSVLIAAGVGALALVLLVILVPLVLAALRRPPPRAPAALAPTADEDAAWAATPLAAGGFRAGPAGRVRAVVPSAAPAEPPPEGLFVLHDAAVAHPSTPVGGLFLAVRRAEVLRVHGAAAHLGALREGLAGRRAMGGTVAAGGTSLGETPVLFARRVQDGLGPAPSPQRSAAQLMGEAGAARGLPESLVARRIERDLDWLGDRRSTPLGGLSPFDRWKVRLAAALVHRPHVLVLGDADTPGPGEAGPAAVGAVLRGVAAHYDVLVVLLDDGRLGAERARAWAHEEVRLGAGGFTERHLLTAGRPAAPAPEARRPPTDRSARQRPGAGSSRGPHP